MQHYRSNMLSAVLLVAVAIQPLMVCGAICCPIVAEAAKANCCGGAGEQDSVVQRSCCQTPRSADALQRSADCCCCKGAPASATVDTKRTTWREFEEPFAIDGAARVAVPAADSRPMSAFLPVGARCSGPPLLALYCIWLK